MFILMNAVNCRANQSQPIKIRKIQFHVSVFNERRLIVFFIHVSLKTVKK
jgi:hypothetical protein